ncbi:MAG: hypothetical protein ABSB22_03670 [Thermodesulfobacteriota bacterium]
MNRVDALAKVTGRALYGAMARFCGVPTPTPGFAAWMQLRPWL